MKKLLIIIIVLIGIVIKSFSQWNDINPFPVHNVGLLEFAHFTSPNIGYLRVLDTNSNFIFLKTEDQGNTYQVKGKSPKAGYLAGMLFLNDSVALLNIQSGKIFITKDGCDTFYHIYSFSDNMIEGYGPYKNMSDNIFISYGRNLERPDSIGAYKSIDTGYSWTKVCDTAIRIISFINDSIGFGIGFIDNTSYKKIFKTINGGNSWYELNESNVYKFSKKSFYFDEKTFYFTLVPDLIRTDNAGITWDTIIKTGYLDYYFLDKNIGFYITRNLYKTTNGGESWEALYNQFPPDYYFNKIQCIKENGKVHFILSEIGGSRSRIYYGTFDSTDIWTTGISDDRPIITAYKVFPNPTEDIITITYTGFIKYGTKARIYDISGRLVKEQLLGIGETKLELARFSRGVYLLKIEDENGVFVEKIVKK